MKKPLSLLCLLMIVLSVTACSDQSRQAIIGWVRDSGAPAAAEGARIALTAAAEAAGTNVPVAQTAAAIAVSTGAPIARTLVSEGVPLAGTLGAEVLATGGPIAGTAVSAGLDALGTRTAEQPGYSCPAGDFTVNTNLNGVVDISGEQLDAAIAATVPGSPLIGLGRSFVDAGRANNVNAYYIAAHAAWDSTWGTNAVATRKNNLFGYGMTPSCPFDCAVPFNSQQESIDFVIPLLKADYLTPGGRFYNGGTPAGVGPIYSGNPGWAEGVTTIMTLLRQNTPCP